jgi:hypothetical protein
LLGGCVDGGGFARTDARACAPTDPPRLCLEARPDRSIVLSLGALRLVPGECARGPAGTRGGTATVQWGPPPRSRSIALSRGAITHVRVDDRGRARMQRQRCTLRPS